MTKGKDVIKDKKDKNIKKSPYEKFKDKNTDLEFSFGRIKSINRPKDFLVTEEAEIYLFYGKHTGPNKGFGIVHIFEEHKKEMEKIGLYTIEDVPEYVAKVVCPGTSLYFEGREISKPPHPRVLAVRGANGTAILEYRHDVWSIVTVYTRPNRTGTAIGRII